jgi:hypothetical protein
MFMALKLQIPSSKLQGNFKLQAPKWTDAAGGFGI